MISYSSIQNLNISLNGLSNNSNAVSDTINNVSSPAENYIFLLRYQFSSNPSSEGYLRIRIEASLDGTNFQTIEFYDYDLYVEQNTNQNLFFFSLLEICNTFHPYPYFRIRVFNNAGASLASSNNEISYVKVLV